MEDFLRRYATPLSLVTGVAVSITGLMMLFGVRGELGDVHEWIGVAFVLAIAMHIVRNWRGLKAMFNNRVSKILVGVAGATLLVLIGTSLPSGAGNGGHQGGPWMVVNRIADAPIATAAPALGMTGEQAVAKLQDAGIAVENAQQSLSEIAEKQDKPLPHIFGVLLR